jgi:hypothetical protein
MIKKGINFQCSDAHVQTWISFMQPTTYVAVSAVSKLLGGTWVGGFCELTEHKIKIYANWANKEVMGNLKEFVIPLEDITNVEVEKTFTTDIIILYFGNTLVKMRCFKASFFANQIKDYINKKLS